MGQLAKTTRNGFSRSIRMLGNFLVRIFRSFIYRSGLLINVGNLVREYSFKSLSNRQTFKRIDDLISRFTESFFPTELVFLGSKRKDGTYPILKHRVYENRSALSFGVGNNITFEIECSKLKMQVNSFDHTVAPAIPKRHMNRISYMPIGICGKIPARECMTIREILSISELKIEDIEIVKMDIEGNEWEVLEDDWSIFSQVPQFIVELHNLDRIVDHDYGKLVKNVIRRILVTHQVVYLSPNNFSGHVMANDKIWPFTIEALFVRKDLKLGVNMAQAPLKEYILDHVTNWKFGKNLHLLSWFHEE
jgi:hypothetical protein